MSNTFIQTHGAPFHLGKLFSSTSDIWMHICVYLEGIDIFTVTRGLNADLRCSFMEGDPQSNEMFWRTLYRRDFLLIEEREGQNAENANDRDVIPKCIYRSTKDVFLQRTKLHWYNFQQLLTPPTALMNTANDLSTISQLTAQAKEMQTTFHAGQSDHQSTRSQQRPSLFESSLVFRQSYTEMALEKARIWRNRYNCSCAHQDNSFELHAFVKHEPKTISEEMLLWIGNGGVVYEQLDMQSEECVEVSLYLYPLRNTHPLHIYGNYQMDSSLVGGEDTIRLTVNGADAFTERNHKIQLAHIVCHLFGIDNTTLEESTLRRFCSLFGNVFNGGAMFKKSIAEKLRTSAGLHPKHMVM